MCQQTRSFLFFFIFGCLICQSASAQVSDVFPAPTSFCACPLSNAQSDPCANSLTCSDEICAQKVQDNADCSPLYSGEYCGCAIVCKNPGERPVYFASPTGITQLGCSTAPPVNCTKTPYYKRAEQDEGQPGLWIENCEFTDPT